MLFGLRAFLNPAGTSLPPPSSPKGILDPALVLLLVLVPPVGLFVAATRWWRSE
jgi:hypothetical protein